jgi:serine/threonine-protein kinase
MVGKRIGVYVVRRKLGQGGMGVVFEAVHESIGQRVAIKMLHSQFSQDDKVTGRFLNEARANSIVRHPGLVNVYDFQKLPDGTVYLVMEFLEGESLESSLVRLRPTKAGMPQAEAAAIIGQAASALAAVHQAGIVHCDLKPDNIYLVQDPAVQGGKRVKILDFGIAKFLSNSLGQTTTTNLIMGTPRYMAPEQCEGREWVDSKVDTYALGVIFYELLAGERPFDAQSMSALMRQHINMKPRPLRERVPGLNEGWAELAHDMLAKDGARRPSMREVQERIESAVATAQKRHRNRALRWLAVTLLPLLVLAASLMLLRRQKTPSPPSPQARVSASVPLSAPPAAPTPPAIVSPTPTTATAPAPAAAPEPSATAKPAVAPGLAATPGKRRGKRTATKPEDAARPVPTATPTAPAATPEAPPQASPSQGVLKPIDFGK